MRHRTLAEVLKRIGAPLDRADLALVASALLNKLEPLRKELLARRHKLVEGTASEVTHPQVQQAIARLLRQPDEGALSKLLIEVVLLEFTDRAPTSDPDVLIATAKRHRVDVDKVRKAVEQEFTAKRAKQSAKQTKPPKKAQRKPQRKPIQSLRRSAIVRAPFFRLDFHFLIASGKVRFRRARLRPARAPEGCPKRSAEPRFVRRALELQGRD